jgi:hypothetical protein
MPWKESPEKNIRRMITATDSGMGNPARAMNKLTP